MLKLSKKGKLKKQDSVPKSVGEESSQQSPSQRGKAQSLHCELPSGSSSSPRKSVGTSANSSSTPPASPSRNPRSMTASGVGMPVPVGNRERTGTQTKEEGDSKLRTQSSDMVSSSASGSTVMAAANVGNFLSYVDPDDTNKNIPPMQNPTPLEEGLLINKNAVKALLLLSQSTHNDQVPGIFMWIYTAHQQSFRLARFVIAQELNRIDEKSLLWRAESPYTRALSAFALLEGYYFLMNVVAKKIKKILSGKKSFEIDEHKLGEGQTVEENSRNLIKATKGLMEAVLSESKAFAKEFRKVLKFLYEKAEAKFPGTGNKAVGNLVYLRLITPNLVQPKNHLTKGKDVSKEQFRNLMLMSKLIMCIANEVKPSGQMGKPEFQSFVDEMIPRTHKFAKELLKWESTKKPLPNYWDQLDMPQRELDEKVKTLYSYCYGNLPGIRKTLVDINAEEAQESYEMLKKDLVNSQKKRKFVDKEAVKQTVMWNY